MFNRSLHGTFFYFGPPSDHRILFSVFRCFGYVFVGRNENSGRDFLRRRPKLPMLDDQKFHLSASVGARHLDRL